MDFEALGQSVQAFVESLGLDISNQQLIACTGIGLSLIHISEPTDRG